jgi:hypothetical protein
MSGHTRFITTLDRPVGAVPYLGAITMGIMRSRRPIMPLALWAMIAALAYAAGKSAMGRKASGRAKAKMSKRRAARKASRSV